MGNLQQAEKSVKNIVANVKAQRSLVGSERMRDRGAELIQ
jgi:hypothetical protein